MKKNGSREYDFVGGPLDGHRRETNGDLVLRHELHPELEELLEASVKALKGPTLVPMPKTAVYKRQWGKGIYTFEGYE